MSPNYSLYGAPFYWLWALAPHMYAVSYLKKNSGNFDNSNPRSAKAAESLKKSVPPAVIARYERAEGAHKNSMENAPFFFGTVAIGNIAGLPSSTLNTTVAAYLGLRVLYTFVYINVSSQKWSFVRTAIFAASTGVLFRVLFQAASKLASETL